MPIFHVDVPYHQQDDKEYCGAAAAQMMLATMSLSTYDQAELVQCGLFSANGTRPEALRALLNCRRPEGSAEFVERFDSCRELATQRVAAAVIRQQLGVPVIVHDSTHWVVVTGVALEADPQRGVPYAIKGLFIHDPEPVTAAIFYSNDGTVTLPDGQPMPHRPHDNCGRGDYFGSGNTYVTIYEWLNSYWAAPSTMFGRAGYVTVSNGPSPQPVPQGFGHLHARSVVRNLVGVGEAEARCAIEQGIRDHRIDQQGPLKDQIAGCTLGDIAHQTEIGQPPRRSCQIRLMKNDDDVGCASVDTDNGQFLGVQAPSSTFWAPTLLGNIAQQALLSNLERLSDLIDLGSMGPDLYTVHPTFVWRPCRQSMSRYYPFIQVNLAGAIVYVGMDGRVHRRLTPHDSE